MKLHTTALQLWPASCNNPWLFIKNFSHYDFAEAVFIILADRLEVVMKLSHSNRKPAPRTVLKTATQVLAALTFMLAADRAPAQTVLPPDANFKACDVTPDQFKSWFKNNAVEKDGEVKPADSLGFVANSECAFYRWSEQMFLWLTSPLSSGRHTFNSSDFFAVSAPDSNGKRALIRQNTPQQKGFAPSIALLPKQPGFVTDGTGRKRPVITLEAPANAASPFVDKSNKPVDVAAVAATVAGKPILLDQFSRAIDFKAGVNGAPAVTGPSAAVKLANTTVRVGNRQRLVTTEGAVVAFDLPELGQATNDVLMTKNEAIVYYLLQVNDVFAYFRIGVVKNAIPPPQQMPSDVPALGTTEAFARTAPPPDQKDSFGDRIALSMELKSSWIDAETLPVAARKDYLTIKAEIPIYETSGNRRKKIDTKLRELALVGFHVAGTASGHPEMIWATFEHVNNAPNLKYSYKNSADDPLIHDKDGPGEWLFSNSGATEPSGGDEITSRAEMDGADIVAKDGQTIGPVNVTRRFPWGSLDTDADTNTKIIAINQSVRSQLANDDVRGKYLLVGAIWTTGTKPTNDTANQRGTKKLANSTMETFSQNRSCFGCHKNDLLGPGLSHIWLGIENFPQ